MQTASVKNEGSVESPTVSLKSVIKFHRYQGKSQRKLEEFSFFTLSYKIYLGAEPFSSQNTDSRPVSLLNYIFPLDVVLCNLKTKANLSEIFCSL